MTQGQGCGSTNIMFDLYLDKESECSVALDPTKLHRVLRKAIKEIGMIRRTGVLDVWESKHSGPATSFHSLQESHVRVETWPKERHVQGEVQLCNYSRNNALAAKRFTRLVIEYLDPATAYVLCIPRGPGPRLRMSEQIEWKRGMPLPF